MLALAWGALLAAVPPQPLVDVSRAVPDAVIELRYATTANLLGRAVYPPDARCLLLAPVAERLARAAARLRPAGLRLRVWDCYRPHRASSGSCGGASRGAASSPNPAKGSNHNRAGAVDVGLAAADGGEVELPTGFDAFEPRARADATRGVTAAARRNRDRLRAAMEAEGFRVNRMEWWHFDAPEARGAPVRDAPLAP